MNAKAGLLTIAHGNWTLWFPPHATRRDAYQLTGRDDTWRARVDDMAEDIVGADSRPILDRDIVTWEADGPVCGFDLPKGMIDRLGRRLRWIDVPCPGRDRRLGNVRRHDHVAPDVFATLLCRFGGGTFDPRSEATR